jgi:hypothetical protein
VLYIICLSVFVMNTESEKMDGGQGNIQGQKKK